MLKQFSIHDEHHSQMYYALLLFRFHDAGLPLYASHYTKTMPNRISKPNFLFYLNSVEFNYFWEVELSQKFRDQSWKWPLSWNPCVCVFKILEKISISLANCAIMISTKCWHTWFRCSYKLRVDSLNKPIYCAKTL